MTTYDESADGGKSVILLCGEVGEEMVEAFMTQFLGLDSKKRPHGITVRITSHGGCAGAGFAIYDAIAGARNRVTTEAWGMVESSAALIFQAGKHRIMQPSARMLLHDMQAEGSTTTGSRGIQAMADAIRASEELYVSLIAARAGIEPKQVIEWMRATTTFSAREAVRAGLADEVPSVKGVGYARVRP